MKGREQRPCRLCFVGVYVDQALPALTVQESFLISFVHDSRELRDVSFFCQCARTEKRAGNSDNCLRMHSVVGDL